MATMWTLSRSVAPASARPIRANCGGPGGGTWGGSGSQSLREALKCESKGKGATSPGELDHPQTNGDRLDYCLYVLADLQYFTF